jgi:hypothetical protein
MPILNDAGIAQVSPAATATDLTVATPGVEDAPELYRPSGSITFTRVIPNAAVVEAASRQVDPDLASEALAPESLPAAGQGFVDRFRSRFGREPDSLAAYGYEAMAVVLDAIEQRDTGADSLRTSVREALLKVERFEESAIGPYSFDTAGDTTLCEVQVYSPALKPLRTVCPSG